MTTHRILHLPCLANKYSESVGGGDEGVGGERRCSKRSAATVIGCFLSRDPAVPPTFAISVADVFDFGVWPSQRGEGKDHMLLLLSSVAAVVAAEVERMSLTSGVRSMSDVSFHFCRSVSLLFCDNFLHGQS